MLSNRTNLKSRRSRGGEIFSYGGDGCCHFLDRSFFPCSLSSSHANLPSEFWPPLASGPVSPRNYHLDVQYSPKRRVQMHELEIRCCGVAALEIGMVDGDVSVYLHPISIST